jgi:hypothetical protein
MPTPVVRESRIVEAIMKAAREKYGADIAIFKRHGTVFSVAGLADLYGCLSGRHFELEVKRPGERPTPIQEHMLSTFAIAGAITGCAHSVDEALDVLRGAYR